MKRYLIFVLIGPLVGGFLLLLISAIVSGAWDGPAFKELSTVLWALLSTLQYSYLFGLFPSLIMAAVDDILAHIHRLPFWGRLVINGVLAFAATRYLYGAGVAHTQAEALLFGLVGLIPAVLSSWLAHKFEPTPPPQPH